MEGKEFNWNEVVHSINGKVVITSKELEYREPAAMKRLKSEMEEASSLFFNRLKEAEEKVLREVLKGLLDREPDSPEDWKSLTKHHYLGEGNGIDYHLLYKGKGIGYVRFVKNEIGIIQTVRFQSTATMETIPR